MWCNDEGFSKIVSTAWDRMGAKPSMGEVVATIDKFGKDLKIWNKNVFENINSQIKEA